jgi:phage/plasmid-like protein (TIGR03299 family)
MAHELEIVDGKASMAYVGQVPWHGLGKEVKEGLSPQEFLKEAGLDWSVEKVPLYYRDKSGLEHRSDRTALIRSTDGAHLTTISGHWNEVQNLEAFEFFDEFVKAGKMHMHTAGSLLGGRMIWALARIDESFEVFGSDRIDPYMLFSLPHQYGMSTDVRFTPIRAVCHNTLTLALAGKNDLSVKINHRKKFDPELAKNALGIARTKLENYKIMAEYLGKKKAEKEQVLEYFKTIFPSVANDNKEVKISRPAKIALEVLETQPGAKYAEGSWWPVYNAVTYSIDHLLGREAESRIRSAWYGQNRVRKISALELASELAEKSPDLLIAA